MKKFLTLTLLLAVALCGCATTGSAPTPTTGPPAITDQQILVTIAAEALGRSECANYIKAHPTNGPAMAARLADVRALLAKGASYDALANALLKAVPPADVLYAAAGLQIVRNHLPAGAGGAGKVDPASDAGRVFAALLDGCALAGAK
jgi:hypothetical protein